MSGQQTTEQDHGYPPDSPVAVPDLVYQPDGADVVVGRHATGAYVVLPADAAAVIQRLAEGMTPAQAGAWYEREHGEDIDVLSLLDDLVEFGVLPGPGAAPDASSARAAAPVRWRRLGELLFSRPALIGYGLLALAGLAVLIWQPDLRPTYDQIFFTDYLTVVTIVLAVGQWPLILCHEAAHALAGRRLGLHTRMSISTRLNYLVVETAMDGLVTVPRRKRWLPMIAGIGCDLVMMAVLTLVAAALRAEDGSLPLAARLCLALSYGTLLRVVWQLFFYLRTDIYYLLSLVLGTVDLHGTAARMLGERLRRLTRRPAPERSPAPPHPTDVRAARWYMWLMVVGYAVTLTTFGMAIVPLAARFVVELVGRIADPGGIWHVIDSYLVFLLAVGQLALVAVVAIRNRAAARAQL
ncbi:hypothetical protein [Plantactinospora sp. KBS50]|uniref:hypothetical protein n=1 Tax=Plantactinospora sp. KBS50 TaxID=2024580 RepID=UPI000BAAA21A|nr:hypothetical protein [Plantactinospora sp. KBS50]ASW55429.1 hypothetical protein CIK06_16515 [Plantactinospora sp. KBS50]